MLRVQYSLWKTWYDIPCTCDANAQEKMCNTICACIHLFYSNVVTHTTTLVTIQDRALWSAQAKTPNCVLRRRLQVWGLHDTDGQRGWDRVHRELRWGCIHKKSFSMADVKTDTLRISCHIQFIITTFNNFNFAFAWRRVYSNWNKVPLPFFVFLLCAAKIPKLAHKITIKIFIINFIMFLLNARNKWAHCSIMFLIVESAIIANLVFIQWNTSARNFWKYLKI